MSLFDTLRIVIASLDDAGTPHMIAGSLASTYHGEPRATQDIDLVIDPPSPEALIRFAASLDRESFHVGDHATAFERREPFDVIDTATGWNVDLIVRRDRQYSRTEFDHRQPGSIESIPICVASPEDTILSKLEWARMDGSERQLRDVRSIVRTVGDSLDREYLLTWASQLGVQAQLIDILG